MSRDLVNSSMVDLTDGPERKRRRKVLSCWDCRRRKLQCDRALPACGRCSKADKANDCLYTCGIQIDSNSTGPASTRLKQQGNRTAAEVSACLESQDTRIKGLEAAISLSGRSHTTAVPRATVRENGLLLGPESSLGNDDTLGPAMDRDSMVLRGRAFKTRCFGSTTPGAMMSFIPELTSVTKQAFEHFPALTQMRADAHALEKRINKEDASMPPVQDQSLKCLMPSKTDADELVHIYVDSFENIYHILHLPTFWKCYGDMWADMDTAPPHFIAVVLLMMACVSCLSSQPHRYAAQSSTARERALHWISHCEAWSSRQSQKHVTGADFQIRCLIWLSSQTNARKIKRAWTDAGTLLRFCMSAGLHRNPDLIQKETSALDKELRCRIWATAVDFELQASFDRGMVSAPWLPQSDSPAPTNAHDKDLTVDKISSPLPLHEFTPASYLALAHDSLMLRSTLNAVLNNIRQRLTFDEVKHYTEEIESHLAKVPAWRDPRSDLPKALLSLRLQQYLMALHDQYIRQADTPTERNFSKSILLETALRMTETHKSLVAKDHLALELHCLDPLRIAVSITHLHSLIDSQVELAFSRSFDSLMPQVMDGLIALILDKLYRSGREGRQLWIVLACDTVMKIKKDPDQKESIMQQAVDKIINPVCKIMACQELIPATKETRTNDNELLSLSRLSATQDVPPLNGIVSPTLMITDEFDDWTFQDWFSTTDIQTAYQSLQDLPFGRDQ